MTRSTNTMYRTYIHAAVWQYVVENVNFMVETLRTIDPALATTYAL